MADKVQVDIVTNSEKANSSMLKYAAGVGVAVAAVAGLVKIGKQLVDAYAVQEQAETRLTAAIKATGRETEISVQAMGDYASSLQEVTLFGDEAILSGQALLQSLADLDQEGLQKVTPAVLDFATAMGVDVTTAMSLVGKTLGSSTNALARYGIEIDTSGTKTEKMAQLTEALESKFGGMAEAAGATATGSFVQLGNATGDLQEALGQSIAEGLEPMARATTKIVGELTDWINKQREARNIQDEINETGKTTSTVLGDLDAALQRNQDQLERATKDYEGYNSAYTKGSEAIAERITALEEEKTAIENQMNAVRTANAELEKNNALNAEYADISKENIIANERQAAALERLEELRMSSLSETDKQIEALQKEIDHWAKFRDLTGVQELLNELIADRNELLSDGNEVLDDQAVKIDATMQALINAEELFWSTGEAAENLTEKVEEIDASLENITKSTITAFASAFSALADENTTFWDAFKQGSKDAVSAALKGLGELAIIQATTAFLGGNFIGGIGYTGAATAAYAAAGVVQSFPVGGTFTTTGPTPIMVGDNASGQEEVTVTPKGGSSSGGGDVFKLIGPGNELLGFIQRAGIDNRGLHSSRGGAI